MNIRKCENDHFITETDTKFAHTVRKQNSCRIQTQRSRRMQKGKNRQEERTEGSSSQEKYVEKDIRQDYRKLTELLIEWNMSITTMESATAGQIASLITDTEGASAIFKGASITYSNETKIMQGVSAEVIHKYTVYSKETAEAMATACANMYGVDIGIGVTGTMGNTDPDNADASVPGQVYFAISLKGSVRSYVVEIPQQPSRLMYKLAVAKEVYDVLMRLFE